MKFIGNIIWFFIYGFWFAIAHFTFGLALCASLIFIPFGIQHIKIARYAIWPFGRSVDTDFDKHPIMNLIWIVFAGLWLAILHITVGVVLCVTIIGIPFAKKCFKLAGLSFVPFGAMMT